MTADIVQQPGDDRHPLNDAAQAAFYCVKPESYDERYRRIRLRVARRDTDSAVADIIGLQDSLHDALGRLAHALRGIDEAVTIAADAMNREEQARRANCKLVLYVRHWQKTVADARAETMLEDFEAGIDRAATAEYERDQAKAGLLAAHKRLTELEAAHTLLSEEMQRAQDEVLVLAAARAVA